MNQPEESWPRCFWHRGRNPKIGSHFTVFSRNLRLTL